jgi:digeranylgeranylglycerophospholipid reductase
MIDALVIGAGPGGLVAATKLAAAGFETLVCEEHESIGVPVHCTGVLAAEVIASLGPPGAAVLNPLSRVQFVAPSGQSFEYTTPTTEAVVIDRQLFDHALYERAVAAGAVVRLGCRATSLDPERFHVTVGFDDGHTARARAVILACGANYSLQRRLGLGLPVTYLQSAQLELPADDPGDVEIHFGSDIAPKGFAWAVPVYRANGSHARIGVMATSDAGDYFVRMLARVAERWGVCVPAKPVPRRRVLPLGALRRTYTDRVLTVGDAAGLVKPTTGGGIFYSVVTGELAANVLAEQLRADALSAGALRRYETEWRRRFHSEFAAQHVLRSAAERMADADIDELFDLARTDGILPLVRQTARFNRHRELILSLTRHTAVRRVLFRRVAQGYL